MTRKTLEIALIVVLALTLIIALFITLMPGLQSAKSTSKVITVPVDYPTIQAAIDNASPGDIINVKNGFYKEKLVVDIPLSLVGQNKQKTIIDGNGTGSVIRINSNNVEVANFTISNAGTSDWFGQGFPDGAFDIEGVESVTIRNNIVTNATVGIWSYASANVEFALNLVSNTTTMGIVNYACTNGTIDSNLLENCGLVGIHLDGNSAEFEITNNNISSCVEGIDIEKSAGNTLLENRVQNNDEGLAFSSSNQNLIEYCLIENNTIGIDFYQSDNNNTFVHNSFIDNLLMQVAFNSTEPSKSASGTSLVNNWDNGKEGNFWSDYQTKYPTAREVDASGIGNMSYIIDANNADHYPLMNQR